MTDYFSFQWHITDVCDQCCQHCYVYHNCQERRLDQTALEHMRKILDNCLDLCTALKRIPYVYITGGDPLLHNNFWHLAELLQTRSVDFAVMGNPFRLTEEICSRLRSCGCDAYQFSLDGLKRTHDRIRSPGSFDAVLGAVRLINAAGMESAVMTTVSGANIGEIPALIDIVTEHEVSVFAFSRYCPGAVSTVPGRMQTLDFAIPPFRYRELLCRCWDKFTEYRNGNTVFMLKDHLWTLFLYEKGLFTLPENIEEGVIYDGCNCGISHLTILPSGEVYACRRIENPASPQPGELGNALNGSLRDMFLSPRMDAYRNFGAFRKCADCELLQFCRGCPAVAAAYTGSFYGADPQCWKAVEPAVYGW
jgi:radical SAM/SPASM domain protein of ACGX system